MNVLGQHRSMVGWRRQPSDQRDLVLLDHGPVKMQVLPPSASTREVAAPDVREQHNLGSCTWNAGAAAAGYLVMKLLGDPDPHFSRLFGYAVTRRLEGVPLTVDSGCYVRSVFKAMRRWGVCFESTWPYDVSKVSVDPSEAAYREAEQYRALTFYACPSLNAIKQSLADGYPVIGGFCCFPSMFIPDVAKTGVVPAPQLHEPQVGGHCVYFDSYDDATDTLGFMNSWGVGWGAGGYGTLPQDFVRRDLATDFHTLRIEAMIR